MKVLKKIISLILTAAIMVSMVCVGTVSASADSNKIYDIVTSSTPENWGYNYIGQDLYYAPGTGDVYKITDNDVANWKKTGKLNKTKVKLPSEMNGMWNLYSNQNFRYSDVGLFHKDGKQILGKYNSSKNTITKIYSTENYCGISENGVIGEFEYNDKTGTLTLNLVSSAGKKIDTLTFTSPNGCSWQSFSNGSKYCYVVICEKDGNTKLIRIDEKGNKKTLFSEKLSRYRLYSGIKNCLFIETELGDGYCYFADTDKLEKCEYAGLGYTLSGTQLYGNIVISEDKLTGKKLLLDVKNQKIVSDSYAGMATEDEKLFLVLNDKSKYGFINKNGKEITKFYDAATPFKNGYALVTESKKSYFIDEKGNRVSEKFDGVAHNALGDGVYLYTNNDKYYIVTLKDTVSTSENSTGKKISSLTFSKVSNYGYSGKAIKPAVTVKDGSYTLKKGTDYTLSYKNNKDIGTATITIKGKGSYTGSKTIEFKIVPKKATLKVSKKSDTKATFTWTAVKGAEKYQIYYSTDGKTYKKLATVSGSKTSATVSKLDFKKYDYKFKIRSYDTNDSAKYYSSFSKVVTVK